VNRPCECLGGTGFGANGFLSSHATSICVSSYQGAPACISVVLHSYLNWGGFFLNLSTTVVGILITVWCIDAAIRRIQVQRWRDARSAIASELGIFLAGSLHTLADDLKTAHFGTFIGDPALRESPIELGWPVGPELFSAHFLVSSRKRRPRDGSVS
jgi:hypothetical protein